jgi:NADH-quinone oxidoreductase subunit C/D
MSVSEPTVVAALRDRIGSGALLCHQPTFDGIPTCWVGADRLLVALRYLKQEATVRYSMLFDLTAVDERLRRKRAGLPDSEFTIVYLLLSLEINDWFRIKLALPAGRSSAPSATSLWPSANWYEREVYDLFGIGFDGHPNLRRIIMPPTWQGHPLRKDHPARATEMGPFRLSEERQCFEQEALRFVPEDWGMQRRNEDNDFLFLNLGPNHPSVHGVFRIALQLDGEEIVDAVPDIGYHHRGAEKMGERQSWHTYIPYTDRVD